MTAGIIAFISFGYGATFGAIVAVLSILTEDTQRAVLSELHYLIGTGNTLVLAICVLVFSTMFLIKLSNDNRYLIGLLLVFLITPPFICDLN